MSPMAPRRTTSRRKLDCVCKVSFSHNENAKDYRWKISIGFVPCWQGVQRRLLAGWFKHREEIPAAMHHAFDSNRIFTDAKQNYVMAKAGHARVRANLRPNLEEARTPAICFILECKARKSRIA